MSPRVLFHIPTRVLQVAAGAVIVLLISGIALTRTQVGREALKVQLESTFNNRFFGHLEIGRLSGNLLFELYARNVVLYDPAGHPAISADSVYIRPSWWDLLQNRVSISSIHFQRPQITVHQSDAGSLNLTELFTLRNPRPPSEEPPTPWSISSAAIRITDGTLRTENNGPLPPAVRSSTIFDYTNTLITGIYSSIAVEWEPDLKLIDISEARFRIPEVDLEIARIRGQASIDENQTVVRGLEVATDESQVRLDGNIQSFNLLSGDTEWNTLRQSEVDLHLISGRVNATEWRGVFPNLVDASFNMSGRIQGRPTDMRLSDFQLTESSNRLAASGAVRFSADSVSFDLDVPASRFQPTRLAELTGIAPPEKIQHIGEIEMSGAIEGATGFYDRSLRLASDIDIRERQFGRVTGQIGIKSTPGMPLSYSASLFTPGFDPGAALNDDFFAGRLAGDLDIAGSGTMPGESTVTVKGLFTRSQLNTVPFDTLTLDLEIDNLTVSGNSFMAYGGGSLSGNGTVDFGGSEPQYSIDLLSRAFDIQPFFPAETIVTRLYTDVSLSGSGLTASDFEGLVDLHVYPSRVATGNRITDVPEFASELTVRKGSDGVSVDLISDIADVTIQSQLDLDLLTRMGEHWVDGIVRSIDKETDKPFFTESRANAVADSLDRIRVMDRRDRLATALDNFSDRYSFVTEAFLTIRQPEILSSIFSGIPEVDSTFQISWYSKANADFAEVDISTTGDHLDLGGSEIGPFSVSLEMEGSYDYTLERSVDATLIARADSARFVGQEVDNFDLEWRYQHASSQLFFTADRVGASSMFEFFAGLDLLDDRNRITIVELTLDNPNFAWRIPSDQIIDIYEDAVIFDDLMIERTEVGSGLPHVLWADGMITDREGEALRIYTANIELMEISELARIRHLIGGTLNAAVVWTGGFSDPLFTSSVSVEDFSLENRILGTFVSDMVYSPTTNMVELEANVRQPRIVSDTVLNNEIEIVGNLSLPGGTLPDGSRDPGNIDLAVGLGELDLFFFDILFPSELENSTGRGTGVGRISGTFDIPIFDADLAILESQFEVPDFNLTYSLTGDIRVDKDGFHLMNMDLNDTGQGKAIVDGDILFNEYRNFSFDITAELDELQIMNVAYSKTLYWYGFIWASGPATLVGPLDQAVLSLPDVVTSPNSELFIPITGGGVSKDDAFFVLTDSTGQIPERQVRTNLLANRPEGERTFLDGLSMQMNIEAPSGSTIHLVFDPLLGDVINAKGSGEIQLDLRGEDFRVFGDFNVEGGDYLFTVQDLLFRRRFELDPGGKMTWDGDPINARLSIPASYRTRASTAGLPGVQAARIPLNVLMNITGDVITPIVDLRLEIDKTQSALQSYENLETLLNSPGRAPLYASSVLLTNSFVLAASLEDTAGGDLGESGRQLVYNSLSQVVANFLNRVVSQVLENVSFNLGIHQGASFQDLDVAGGISIALLDDRVLIRGEGIIGTEPAVTNELTGEVVIEYRFTPNLTGQIFYRRLEELFTETVTSGGVGISYQRSFSSWAELLGRTRTRSTDTTPPGSAR